MCICVLLHAHAPMCMCMLKEAGREIRSPEAGVIGSAKPSVLSAGLREASALNY